MSKTYFPALQINELARSYNALFNKGQLLGALTSFYHPNDLSLASKFELHKKFSDLLTMHYLGESTIKHLLFKEFIDKKVIAAFEMRVNTSRVDFVAINGVSKSFEIKSGLDNLQKLSKQSIDYSKAFEYNFIIIDEKHKANALDIIPSHYGVWFFSGQKKIVHRHAKISESLDPEFQLSLLTKKELKMAFKSFRGIKNEILRELDSEQVNKQFKSVLKLRYSQRWAFVKENVEKILPIDIQFFFSTNLNPDLIYQTANQ